MSKEMEEVVEKADEMVTELVEKEGVTTEEAEEMAEVISEKELREADEKECEMRVENWLADHPIDDEDKEAFEIIDKMAASMCRDNWNLGIEIPGLCIAIYGTVFEEIIKELKAREAKHKEFFINVASIFGIGFESDDDDITDGEEKNKALRPGGIRPRIIPLDNCVENVAHEEDVEVYTDTKTREWCDKNIKEQNTTLMNIASRAVKDIDRNFKYTIGRGVYIWPIFHALHSRMQEFLHVKRTEEKVPEKDLSVLGYYTMKSKPDPKTGTPIIRYEPKQWMKVALKDDDKRQTNDSMN